MKRTRVSGVFLLGLFVVIGISFFCKYAPIGYFSINPIDGVLTRLVHWIWPPLWLSTIYALLDKKELSSEIDKNTITIYGLLGAMLLARTVLLLPLLIDKPTISSQQTESISSTINVHILFPIFYNNDMSIFNIASLCSGILSMCIILYMTLIYIKGDPYKISFLTIANIILQQIAASMSNYGYMMAIWTIAILISMLFGVYYKRNQDEQQ